MNMPCRMRPKYGCMQPGWTAPGLTVRWSQPGCPWPICICAGSAWRNTFSASQGVRALADLLWTEFAKLRRQRMLWLLLLGSAVMPAFTYLYYFTHPGCGYTFLSLYRQGMFSLGAMVLLPICLGVLAAILVDSERSTRVLWQLWIVPV